MDKKQKWKRITAICFVAVCGVVCLGSHYGKQKSEQPVFEKSSVGSALTVGSGDEESAVFETEKGNESESPIVSEQMSETTVSDTERLLYVHVCGAVVNEGVYALAEGSRVTDCIATAGGFLQEADTTYHNLAARLKDGQKVYVPTVEETRGVSTEERVASAGERREDALVDGTGKVNLNTADVEGLMTLSGIGEAKAESIIQYREKVGPFQSIEELKCVTGIGDAMFERVKEYIVVE